MASGTNEHNKILPMETLLELLRKHDKRGDGTITKQEISRLLQGLDKSGYWTNARLEKLCAGLRSNASDQSTSFSFHYFVQKLYSSAECANDFESVRNDLKVLMISPEWDDGSYAPLLIRLAWHSSGTYSHIDGSGGSNGATMRHALEASDPENAGLAKARELLEVIRAKHPWMSYSDLWILAAYVALEQTNGPVIPFKGGRTDAPAEKAIPPGRLPGAERGIVDGWKLDSEGRMEGWEHLARHVRDVFSRMGLSDREAVALICGGHVYGRCHTEHSGYAGAWVENPTLFSNEYPADMIGDEWIAVTHNTTMPDGGPVPEEVRPAPGKRQYIDLSKYLPADDEKKVLDAPNADNFSTGSYVCVSSWVNVREMPDTTSQIIGRLNQEEVVTLVSVKVFGTAVRGLAERGGWVSIVGSGGKTLFERRGDVDSRAMTGRYRVVASAGAPFFSAPGVAGAEAQGRVKTSNEFCVAEVSIDKGGTIFGKRGDVGDGQNSWIRLFSPTEGQAAELVVSGYNEKPRKAIKGQTGHQMMLVSDMVLLWDQDFRKILQEYADDEALLKEDFGNAFKRLTELGCPWSADRPRGTAGCAAGSAVASAGLRCPVMQAAQ
eukprot:TRINITY_DN34317_c0_g1_i1.p1 TRINITY_DN34317_c0_g1~~TRINITY_DN34317_c0_g1_i1.p1  ORF type:complete len:607 (+),score=83.51 TRINITY_DN34317_c0_g1_i1:72-1892(+)